jgi:hypothetical protein
MAMLIGQSFGRYHILEQLGEGCGANWQFALLIGEEA